MLRPQPLVSIVTPAYNEEEHIAECIESVLAQTYENWEYTIVNNCSTDKTLEIARRYAAQDSRIRVHDNEKFLPMLANHNLAIRQISSSSAYCKVVLADDWIYPDCLEKMVAIGEAYPSAGIVSSYQLHGQLVRSIGLPHRQNLVSGRETCRQFLFQTLILFGTQNSVLYRANLVRSRDPFYIETDMCADFEVCFALLKQSDLGFVHQILTFSRPRAGSIAAVSFDTGANFASRLGILFNYGRDCLNNTEFEACLDLHMTQYYTFLGRRLLVERDRRFWCYHEETLAKFGLGLSRTRLIRSALRELFGSALHPSSMLASVRRLFTLRRIRNGQARSVVSGFGAN